MCRRREAMTIDDRVRALGLVLPESFRSPTGTAYPFSWVRGRGNRASISGHLPLQPDGRLAEPRGKVGEALTIEQGAAARLVGLAMVNVSPVASPLARVINGFSAVIVDVFGPERGAHARSAVGVAELPYGVAVEIEAEVESVESALAIEVSNERLQRSAQQRRLT